MKVLLVGGGGREDALAWKIAQSPCVDTLYAAPGNPGIARHAHCVMIAADAVQDLLHFAQRERVDLTVVGPEAPLVAGLTDRFATEAFTVFGPVGRAARLMAWRQEREPWSAPLSTSQVRRWPPAWRNASSVRLARRSWSRNSSGEKRSRFT